MLIIQKREWKNKDGTVNTAWRLIIRDYEGKKRVDHYIKKREYWRYGFDSSDSIEKANEKLVIARAKNKLLNEAEKKVRIEKKKQAIDLKESAYLPRGFWIDFIDWLKEKRMWDELPPKAESHLRCVRRIILEINIDPSDLHERPEKVYGWFRKNVHSISYIQKVLPLLNSYGYYYCKYMKRAFLEIPMPRADVAAKIEEANLDARAGKQAESAPLTEELLSRLNDLPEAQLRWMRFSFYFGLRPNEVDALEPDKQKKVWEVSIDEQGMPYLRFYQSKLTSVSRERRWKRIPAILKEQRALLVELEQKEPIDRPLLKTIQSRLGPEYHLYAGRKGFDKLMKAHGQNDIHISRWLGHLDILRTERHYREIGSVEYLPVKKR